MSVYYQLIASLCPTAQQVSHVYIYIVVVIDRRRSCSTLAVHTPAAIYRAMPKNKLIVRSAAEKENRYIVFSENARSSIPTACFI